MSCVISSSVTHR